MAARQDMDFLLGEHWIIEATCTDNGQPMSVAGGAVEFALVQGTTLKLNLETPSEIAFTDAVNGQVTIIITPTQQAAASLTAGFYEYQIRATTAAGIKSDQLYGNVTVRENIFSSFDL